MPRWTLRIDNFMPANPRMSVKALTEDGWLVKCGPEGGLLKQSGAAGEVGNADWPEARFLTMDIVHHCPNVLTIVVTFAKGNNSHDNDRVIVHYGVLPHVPTRICFPLSALNAERLFLNRNPGTMQTVLRGGTGIQAGEVNYLSIGASSSEEPISFRISNVELTTHEPDFLVEKQPVIDELGQYTGRTWTGKIPNADVMIHALRHDATREESSEFYNGRWGRYGGFQDLQFGATGFFRTQHDGRRWWLVDPEGYAFLSTGFDCVHPGEFMKVNGMAHLTSWLPEADGPFGNAWAQRNEDPNFSYGISNLIRAFGVDWWNQWALMTLKRYREWGLNTVGNWSEPKFIHASKLPYVWPLAGFPTTRNMIFRDFPDVFDESYQRTADEFAKQLLPLVDDPFMVGYFLRNEPHFAFVDSLSIAEKMLESKVPFTSKERLITYLQNKYSNSVDELNRAWNSQFTSFEDLRRPIEKAASRSLQASRDLDEFSGVMVEAYVQIPAAACKRVDPHHLNLGMRYAWISSQHLLRGAQHFDVFSLNTYQMRPSPEVIRRIHEATHLPVMIGEFHHGAPDVGMLATGIRGVRSQRDRGLAYRYFVEQGLSLPEMVGMHYFQWNDQPVLGRFDGENYQIGAVDGCHQPYQDFVTGLKETHRNMYEVAKGDVPPYDIEPEQIQRTGF